MKHKKATGPLADWIKLARQEDFDELCRATGKARSVIYQYSYNWRRMKVENAELIERGTIAVHHKSGGRMPIITRADLQPTCSACPFAIACQTSEGVSIAELVAML